jgi:hypothetical protein
VKSGSIKQDDVIDNISGGIMLQFSKDGCILPDYQVFASIDGGDKIGMWTFYLNPRKTFGPKERIFSNGGKMIEGVKVISISTPFTNIPNDEGVISDDITHVRIYSGKGVSYNSKELMEAYKKAQDAFH